MPQEADPAPRLDSRRRILGLIVNGVLGVMGGALASVLGVFAVRSARQTAPGRWIRAGALADLVPGVPVPRVLSVPRIDGWYRGRARETVFLLWDGASGVRVLSARCTHLGCQVRWDRGTNHFQCPCHGGAYDAVGRVVDGPPPRPLDTLEARIEETDRSVLVRL